MGRKRKNAQNIKTQLRAQSTAQLENAVKGMLDIPDPEEAPDFSSEVWAGPSTPHIIDGQTYEERQKRKKEIQDEKTRKPE